MSKTPEQSGKLKREIIISIVLHTILFAGLIFNSFEEHISASSIGGSEAASTIESIAILVDSSAVMQSHKHHDQQKERTNTKRAGEDYKKQAWKGQKKTHDAQKRAETKKAPTNSRGDNLFRKSNSGKNAAKMGNEIKGDNAAAIGKSNSALDADIRNYAGQIRSAIESRFYDSSSYSGKTCTLRIKLAPDGVVLDIKSERGDPALCNAALVAVRQAKMPRPPSQAVYEIFKNAPLDFKP